MLNLDDKQIIKKYLTGDDSALDFLIKKYLRQVYFFVLKIINDKHEAEDVTQEVFFRAWKNIKKFDVDKNFKTWIFSIAKNASLDFLKKKKSIPFSAYFTEETDGDMEPEENNLPGLFELPNEIAQKTETAIIIQSAVKQLKPIYQTIIYLYYNQQLTFQEISEILGESINTVKSRHRRALILLKNQLNK
jgi:RNA polymerase sigma-70 factor (ECF subfamily)